MINFEQAIIQLLTEVKTISNINNAIDKKQKVRINYEGDGYVPRGTRIIEPYVNGITTAGNSAIRAFQEDGVTATESPGWKIFLYDKITNWEELPDTFEIRQDYNEYGDKLFKRIDKKCQ